MSSESHEKIAQIICHKPEKISCEECFQKSLGHICNGFSQCRILEKTEEQLAYVLSSSHKNIFLKACAGSGKTEVVGMKAAYEIKKWNKQHSGIAVLSFTNDATNVIKERVKQFAENNGTYPHFIGTLSSFIHSYIVQPFAYKLIKYSSNSSDYSIRIIDENMYIYENHWLSKFKCKIPFIHSQESIFTNIYAHQIGYDLEKKDFYIIMKYDLIWLTNYYNSQNVQSYITEKRKNYSAFWEENWVRKCFCDCKKEFWENGFANFDDMNILAIRILKTPIAEQIVKRFPLLLIDECQDLSENELHVIKLLQKNGCYVHFIGDLNQSIYDFKRVNPDKIYDYISNFKTYKLSANFRSCKEIVNFSNRLIKEQNYSKHVHSKFGKNALFVIEYNNPKDAIKKYVDYLKMLKCEDGINRILVKQNSLRKQLQNLTQNTYDEKAP